jgi:adenylate cyclase
LSQNIEIERRLAAVLAADVAGFSRLTDQDEIGTMRMLAAQRAILDAAIARHRGRIANTAGDSVLAEFPSAVNAVQCAVEAQQALRDATEGVADDKRVLFRIGIHVGDVMVRGGDLLGSGVNVAARLEALADAGGIVLSAAAHEQVKKILPLAYTDLGSQSVKNIEEPVRAFAIGATTAASVATMPGDNKPLPLPDKPSIAVLPFQNMSGDPEQEYFADGMVEDIITALSRFKSLFVIARNSSFTYKGKSPDIRQVGRELGVRYVLEGSVRKAGGRVRITGQLIEAATGAHLWADKFDGKLEDVFDLQDAIAEQVVTTLVPTLRRAEIERLERKRPDNLDGYDLVLRTHSLFRKNNPDDLPEAIAHLEKAIQLVPNYALAHALIAGCYTRLYVAGANVNLEEDRRKALAFARRAVELGNDDPETIAYASFALASFGDGELALFLAERSISLNPNLPLGWFMVGSISLYSGDYERALECLARALRLSPIGSDQAGPLASSSMAYLLSDRYEEAYSFAERAYQENPNHSFAIPMLAMSAAVTGRQARAYMAFQRFAPAVPSFLKRTRARMRGSKNHDKIVEAMRLASMPE